MFGESHRDTISYVTLCRVGVGPLCWQGCPQRSGNDQYVNAFVICCTGPKCIQLAVKLAVDEAMILVDLIKAVFTLNFANALNVVLGTIQVYLDFVLDVCDLNEHNTPISDGETPGYCWKPSQMLADTSRGALITAVGCESVRLSGIQNADFLQ